MKLKALTVTAVVSTQLVVLTLAAKAQDQSANPSAADEVDALKKEVQALEEKVNSLEHQISSQATSAPTAQFDSLTEKVQALERQRLEDQYEAQALIKTMPKIALTQNGFSFGSADSNFVAQLHGVLQVDSRSFFQDGANNGNDGFLLRRARPILTGTVFRDFDFNFTPDFGGSGPQIFDAYLNYHYNDAFQLEAGKFKAPVGLEALVADRDLLFNERSLVTDLVPNRDLGVEFHGGVLGDAITYALGLFSGDTDYNGTTVNTPFGDDYSTEGRVFFQPWKNTDVKALRGFGFGVAGSYLANHPLTTASTGLTPGYNTDGQQKFFTYNAGVNAAGAAWRVSPQGYYYYGPLGFLGEYVISDQRVASATAADTLQNSAWEVSGSWVLTGEDASYNGVTPLHPFDPRTGQWGAWQLVARVARLNVDSKAFTDGFASSTKSADEATAWAVGLNWYLNRNVRADISFSRTIFAGFTGAPGVGVVPAQPENVLFTRLQLAF